MNEILELFKIAGKIDLDGVDKANRDLDNLDGKGKGVGGRLGRFAKKVGKAGLIVGGAAAAAGTAAFAMTKKVTDGFDHIAKTSTKLGVSTDAYQEMEYWASQNGIASASMERAVGRLNQRIGMAADGNEKYSSALERLGVDMDGVRNGTVNTEDAMATSIQTLSQMENETEKSALAAELFGTRMARDLMPALQDGSLSLEDAKEKAKELGIVIEEDTLNAAEHFNDTWDDLTRMMGAFGQKILAELMPAFQTMMDWVIEHLPQIQAVFEAVFDAIGFVFDIAIGWIQSLIAWLGEWFESSEITLTGIWEVFEVYLGMIIDYVSFVFENIWLVIKTILDLITPFIQEQLEKIFQFWDENGEKIMNAVDNAFNFIKGVIDFVMPVIIAIIEGAWDIITSVFDTAIGVVMGLVDFFASLLTGDFEGMKDAVIKIWNSLWDGIKGVVDGAWSLLSGAFSALWDSISGWFTGLKDDAVDWGKNMISGFIDGIKSMAGDVGDAAKGVVSGVGDFLKFWSPAKKGEGRYIRHWGRNMIDGFLDGVEDEEDSAGKAMENVVKKMNPGTLSFNAMASVGSRGFIHASGRLNDGKNITRSARGDIVVHQIINSPDPLTPSDTARLTKRSLQEMALGW